MFNKEQANACLNTLSGLAFNLEFLSDSDSLDDEIQSVLKLLAAQAHAIHDNLDIILNEVED